MDKIITVDDSDNFMEQAKEIFADNELTEEYLDARDVTFSENEYIKIYAKEIASNMYYLHKNDLTHDIVKDQIYSLFNNSEFSDCVLDETINILKDKYNIELKDIKI